MVAEDLRGQGLQRNGELQIPYGLGNYVPFVGQRLAIPHELK